MHVMPPGDADSVPDIRGRGLEGPSPLCLSAAALSASATGPYPTESPGGSPRNSHGLANSLGLSPRASRRSVNFSGKEAGSVNQILFQGILKRRLNDLERNILTDLWSCHLEFAITKSRKASLTQAPASQLPESQHNLHQMGRSGSKSKSSTRSPTSPLAPMPVSPSGVRSPVGSFHLPPPPAHATPAEAEHLERRSNTNQPLLMTVPEHNGAPLKTTKDGGTHSDSEQAEDDELDWRSCNSDSVIFEKRAKKCIQLTCASMVPTLVPRSSMASDTSTTCDHGDFSLVSDDFVRPRKASVGEFLPRKTSAGEVLPRKTSAGEVISPTSPVARMRTVDTVGGPLAKSMSLTRHLLDGNKHFTTLPIWENPENGGDLSNILRTSLGSGRSGSVGRMGSLGSGRSGPKPADRERYGFKMSSATIWGCLVVHPGSQLNLCKEALKLFCIIFDFFFIPLQVFELPDNLFSTTLSWLIRSFWMIDIPLSFLTGYFKEQGGEEMSPKRVARHYAKTWLFFDLFCVFFDWLDALMGGIGSLRAFSIGHVARFLRVARLSKSWHSSYLIKQNIRSEQVVLLGGVICSIGGLLGVANCTACLWYMIARYQSQEHATWLQYSEYEDMPRSDLYTVSLHWSLAQFTGELIMKPANNTERVFGLVVYFLFFLAATIFVSTITTSMTRLQIISSKQSSQFAALRRYLLDKNISRQLAMKVQRNAKHTLSTQKLHAEESSVELLEIISTPLRAELHFEVHSPVLCVHPFLASFTDENPPAARKFCHTAVSTLTLAIGDNLFSEGETPVRPRIFFIVTGELEYFKRRVAESPAPAVCHVLSGSRTSTKLCGPQVSRSATASKKTNVIPGHWLCEAVLWTSWTHCGTLKAREECGVSELDAQLFQEACLTFPTLHPSLYAAKFVEYLNELCDRDRNLLTDMPPGDFQISRMLECAFPQWETVSEAEEPVGALSFVHRASQASVLFRPGTRRPSTGTRRLSTASVQQHRNSLSHLFERRFGRRQSQQASGLQRATSAGVRTLASMWTPDSRSVLPTAAEEDDKDDVSVDKSAECA